MKKDGIKKIIFQHIAVLSKWLKMQLNIAIYHEKIDNIMFMENTNIKWEKPVIDELEVLRTL